MSFIANLLAKIGGMTADISSNECVMLILDEPNAPKSLIEK